MSNQFNYKYTAPTEEERKEIQKIKNQYLAPSQNSESKYERLKKLHAKVYQPATTVALILGIIGILIFGLGLTMVLEWGIFVWGVVVMVLGCVPIALAYPVYNLIIKSGKKKYGEEIIKLSNELLGE